MPRRKFIDKKNASTFALVYRPQSDPLINDQDASDMVFKAVDAPNTKALSSKTQSKIGTRGDLEDEFGLSVRANEGEAANYGIFYDDSQYDYMQHMRDLGSSRGAHFIEAQQPLSQGQRKAKGKQRLEDAIRDMEIQDQDNGASSVASERSVHEEMLDDGNEFVDGRRRTYQDQQDIPDAIAGFQPDMDPRLREVLEALNDEAYVDDDQDLFAELAEGAEEVDDYEFDGLSWEDEQFANAPDDDDGWETDDTIKASSKNKTRKSEDLAAPGSEDEEDGGIALPPADPLAAPPDHNDGDWMSEFRKFKTDQKASKPSGPVGPAAPSALTGASSLMTGGRKKKRKGAMTNPSAFSMTSSALARTDEQSTLDMRFDKMLENDYADDDFPDFDEMDDVGSLASGMTGTSRVSKMSAVSGLSRASGTSRLSQMTTGSTAPPLMSAGLESALDGFLDNYETKGRRTRRNKPQSGMEQLDEIRKGLGPAKIRPRTQKA